MFRDLFLISDPAKYNVALNMLSGSVLCELPQLVRYRWALIITTWLTMRPYCDTSGCYSGSVLECRTGSPFHLLGSARLSDAQGGDGDIEAGENRSKRFTGLDWHRLQQSATPAILGVEGGYVTNYFHDSQFGDDGRREMAGRSECTGVDDPGAFYLKGVTTYSSMNGDSSQECRFCRVWRPGAQPLAAAPSRKSLMPRCGAGGLLRGSALGDGAGASSPDPRTSTTTMSTIKLGGVDRRAASSGANLESQQWSI